MNTLTATVGKYVKEKKRYTGFEISLSLLSGKIKGNKYTIIILGSLLAVLLLIDHYGE